MDSKRPGVSSSMYVTGLGAVGKSVVNLAIGFCRALAFVAALTTSLPTLVASEPPAHTQTSNSFTIAAWAFDRGNAKTFTREWADDGPLVAFGGEFPVVVEYDIDFPQSGEYAVAILYAAAEARPV